MHGIGLFFFMVAAGYTASKIVANLYRVSGFTVKSTGGAWFRTMVLIVAGPSVMFEHAIRGYKEKSRTPLSFWIVTMGVMYWSLALGMMVLQIATHI